MVEGEVVLDVGCGTGQCLPMLTDRLGPAGTVVGIDESPQMMALARRRVADSEWRNVTLVESTVERATIPLTGDGALFCAAHDVLRSPDALHNVFAHLRPGAWVAAGGGKWAPPWMIGVNAMVFAAHQPFVRDFEGFDRPWSLLEHFVDDLRVTEVALGGGYLATGRSRSTGPATEAAA